MPNYPAPQSMIFRLIFIVAAAASVFTPTSGFAQTLKEKAGFGGNLSAVEAATILAAEIRYCELNSPDFKSQARASLDRLRADARYKELERNPEFSRLSPEANALVKDRNQGAVVATVCRNVVQQLR